MNLVVDGKQCGLDADSGSGVSLSQVQFEPAIWVQRLQRNFLGNIGAVDLVHIDLIVFLRLRTAGQLSLRCAQHAAEHHKQACGKRT